MPNLNYKAQWKWLNLETKMFLYLAELNRPHVVSHASGSSVDQHPAAAHSLGADTLSIFPTAASCNIGQLGRYSTPAGGRL